MVVGAGDQHPRLADPQRLDQREILRRRADPRGDLRKAIAEAHAGLQRGAVLLRIDEKLRLADQSVFPAQPVEHLVEIRDLLHRKRLGRLLSVAERRVRDPDLGGHLHRHHAVVERHLRHGLVVKEVAVEIRRGAFLERVLIGGLLDQVGLRRIGDTDGVFLLDLHKISRTFRE